MKEREELIEWHRNYCIHYQPREPLCGAGVDTRTVKRVPAGTKGYTWGPCIEGHTLEDPCSVCPHWKRRTLEEAEAYADSIEALMLRMKLVDPVINAWRKKLPIGKSEVIECPACKGRLHLRQIACNGHIRANCETPDCVAFVE